MPTEAPLLGEPLPVELMNTIWADRDGVHDALAHDGGAGEWLTSVRHLAATTGGDRKRFSGPDLVEVSSRLVALRDALRCIAADVTADDRTGAVRTSTTLRNPVKVLNASASAAPSWSIMEARDGAVPTRRVVASAPLAQALVSEIAEAAITLFTGPDRTALRACHAPGCVLYFLKQHSRREWCSAACGNRARVARHYNRHPRPSR